MVADQSQEEARIRVLLEEQVLHAAPDSPFDDLAQIAATTFDAPIAVICFMLRGGPWFKAKVGIAEAELSGGAELCRCVIQQRQPLNVPDLLQDPDWATTSRRLNGVRFYAGVPLATRGGHVVGTICVGDRQPRTFAARQMAALEALGRQVMTQLELRSARTAALEQAVEDLRAEVRERQVVEEELRRSQEQLVQSQKLQAVGQLAGGIAHEFNNILTVIFGYLSVLELGFEPGDARRDDVHRIGESAERAALLTRQLLAFSRHQRLAPELVDLNRLLARQERMLARVIGDNVRVVLTLAPEGCPVRVDPAHVEQVVLNLAINARDAMPDGGVFAIETALLDVSAGSSHEWGGLEPGRYVAMIVHDNGLGMTPEVQSRVFEPFFTTKEVGKGTGLGLSTVYGIVAQNGGHVRVASEPNRGTTFTVLLPLIPATSLGQPESANRAAYRGAETILLVEDEPALRDLAAAILRRQGYWVLEAANGLDALGLAARQPGPIHLLLTDVVMPGMTGAGLARRLLPTRPHTRVLYMSGYTTSPETLGLGPDSDFIGKPFTPAELLARVRGLLDRGSQQAAAAP